MHPRRGLYSYPALQSRLAVNSFARDGLVDLSGPVVRLGNLTPEELYALLSNIRHIQACGENGRRLVPDEVLVAFMEHCRKRIGDAYFRTPRNTVTAFVGFLAVLEQNPGVGWAQALGQVNPTAESAAVAEASEEGVVDDELSNFSVR